MDSLELPPPHVLVFPFPSAGHINPMLSFSTYLSLKGVIVTFINTSKTQERIDLYSTFPARHLPDAQEESLPRVPSVRFHTIPGPYQDPIPPSPHGTTLEPPQLASFLASIESQCEVIEELIVNSRSSDHPISCIVSDSFFPWTHPLAEKLGIQRIIFWTTNGMTFADITKMRHNYRSLSNLNGPIEDDIVRGGVKFRASRFLDSMPASEDPIFFSHLKARLDGIEKATCTLVNTFEELEESSLKATMCETPVRYIGPLAPTPLENNATIRANLFCEEIESLNWLDKQAQSSVIYISFGSVASLTQDQIQVLALGIESSKQPFLWVLRDSIIDTLEGFIERTSARGLIIKWAPQARVLSHPSVGGFLTHCGWNSVLESIHMGVPMLCFPLFGDQCLNALLIEDVWKLGLPLHKGKDGRMVGNEVEKAIISLMKSEDIKERASRWKVRSHRAIQQGGTSNIAMESIILDLRKGLTI